MDRLKSGFGAVVGLAMGIGLLNVTGAALAQTTSGTTAKPATPATTQAAPAAT